MAKSKSISITQVSEITECVICTDQFKEPKVLPCIHTFCLLCLEKYRETKEKDPGDKVTCPLCRKEFTIPQGGFKDLPNNYFIIQLMQLSQSSGSKSWEHSVVCDLCAEFDKKPPATMFCIECEQHLCQPCCTRHDRQKNCKGHQIVSLKDKPNAEELKMMAPSKCEKHPSKGIKFYCYDCKMIACYACYVESHNTHKCSDVKKAGEELRGTIPKNIEKVRPFIAKNRDEMKQIAEEKKSLNDKVVAAKREIAKKYEQLQSLLDLHKLKIIRDKLNAELDSFKAKTLKMLQTREEEVERQSVILESYKRYCEEMKDKGTAVDISRAASDLYMRADELVKTQNDLATTRLYPFNITFTPSCTVTDSINNWIGKLVFKEMSFIRDAPPLRLCHMINSYKYGYGFNLHAVKGKAGQFIGKVDPGSPAESAGLREGDRIVEVNGINIRSENHQQVVQRIKAVPAETKFLVVDADADAYYDQHKIVISGDMSNVVMKVSTTSSIKQTMENGNSSSHKLRLCQMKIWPNCAGYGFDFHAEKGKSAQFIGIVDPKSPAEAAGLKEGDRIIEVNGANVMSETHQEVVKKIKADSKQVTMLLADLETEEYFRENGLPLSSEHPSVVRIVCPDSNPSPGGERKFGAGRRRGGPATG